MKRIFLIFLSILLILGLFPAPTYAAPDWPSNISIEADGGVVMDADSGAVLFGKNLHETYYPASITKVLTALVVLENCDLNEEVTYSYDAVYNEDESFERVATPKPLGTTGGFANPNQVNDLIDDPRLGHT